MVLVQKDDVFTRHFLNYRKTDHKIKNIAFYATARVNDYALVLILNEYTLYSRSAVLLKHKDGNYMLHVASTCHSRGEHRCAKKRRKKKYLRMSERKKE